MLYTKTLQVWVLHSPTIKHPEAQQLLNVHYKVNKPNNPVVELEYS